MDNCGVEAAIRSDKTGREFPAEGQQTRGEKGEDFCDTSRFLPLTRLETRRIIHGPEICQSCVR